MNSEKVEFPGLNRLVHEPARLAILTVLSSCEAADFVFLQTTTGLSRGNLSVQLSNLENAWLVSITKEIIGKKPRTTACLTKDGRKEMDKYWKALEELRALAKRRNVKAPTKSASIIADYRSPVRT